MRTVAIRWLILACVGLSARTALAQAADQRGDNPRQITDAIGMKLVLIPAGEFMMGGQEPAEELVKAFPGYNKTADYFADEYPRHRVRITKPFYLGKFEVTVGQFRRFVKEAPYRPEAEEDGAGGWGYNPATGKCEGPKPEYSWENPGFAQTDEHPVVNVTWNDAVAFCRWLGRKEGKHYRLPTEAEWEYACRGGTTTRYYTGDAPETLTAQARVVDPKKRTQFAHVHEMIIDKNDPSAFTCPVGRFKANPFGLHDMHGNVWEWCADWYAEDYYAKSPKDDPPGPQQGRLRTRRGGGWNSFPLWARASFRNWNTLDSRCVNLGFRVLREM